MNTHVLDSEALAEAVARRVVELLAEHTPRYVSASELADAFGLDRAWIYSHAEELGVVKFGGGARPRLRFDLQRVAKVVEGISDAADSPRRGRPRKSALPPGVEPLRGRRERHSRP
jgi:hypothetical protein